MTADEFAELSELGATVEQICLHYHLTHEQADNVCDAAWNAPAEWVNDQLRRIGPIGLLAKASRMAQHNEKMLTYLLEKLWKPGANGPTLADGLTDKELIERARAQVKLVKQ